MSCVPDNDLKGRAGSMRCANPLCRAESLYFRSGSLHTIDRIDFKQADAAPRRQHVIWLCGECSLRFVVETWRPPGEQLRASAENTPQYRCDLAA